MLKKITGLFFLFLLTIINLQATERLLQSISIAAENDETEIVLNDGLTFSWTHKPYEKEMLSEWTKDDEIVIHPHSFQKGLVLENRNSKDLYYPQVILKNPKMLLTIKSIETISAESMLGNEVIVTLNDGTVLQGYEVQAIKFPSDWHVDDFVIANRHSFSQKDSSNEVEERTFVELINFSLIESDNFKHATNYLELQKK